MNESILIRAEVVRRIADAKAEQFKSWCELRRDKTLRAIREAIDEACSLGHGRAMLYHIIGHALTEFQVGHEVREAELSPWFTQAYYATTDDIKKYLLDEVFLNGLGYSLDMEHVDGKHDEYSRRILICW
jgi:hypothetical protein